jgi:serine/threonine protein kinase
MTKDPSLM